MSKHRLARIATLAGAVAVLIAVMASPAMAGSTIKVRDACDPVSFDAVLGEGSCVRDSSGKTVEFAELLGGEIDAWSFTDEAEIDEGDRLVVKFDRGGEGHSFTEVQAFAGGCIPEVNEILGLHEVVPECATFPQRLQDEFIGPDRRTLRVSGLDAGEHRFMCLIHPWMQSTVTVRED